MQSVDLKINLFLKGIYKMTVDEDLIIRSMSTRKLCLCTVLPTYNIMVILAIEIV